MGEECRIRRVTYRDCITVSTESLQPFECILSFHIPNTKSSIFTTTDKVFAVVAQRKSKYLISMSVNIFSSSLFAFTLTFHAARSAQFGDGSNEFPFAGCKVPSPY